jgi:hypothetical protein
MFYCCKIDCVVPVLHYCVFLFLIYEYVVLCMLIEDVVMCPWIVCGIVCN